MTVSTNETTVLEQIAQLEARIEEAQTERRKIQVQLIAELDREGLSLRTIGRRVGMSHASVLLILKGYKAGIE